MDLVTTYVNTFMEPFVVDLLRFWSGVELNVTYLESDLLCSFMHSM